MWRGLVSGASDLCKGLTTMTAGSRVLILKGTCAKSSRLSSTMSRRPSSGAATSARRRLILAAIVDVWWFRNLGVIFIMFEMLCTSVELL